jgi:hypothetical protein
VVGLEVKTLDRKKLESRFKRVKNPKKGNMLQVSAPIIIGKYSFQFL